MTLKLGFSPCPNDTYIFDALVNNKIDTEGIEFEVFIEDIEQLNKMLFNSELDITKLSFHSYAYNSNNYLLLNSGSALGDDNGPLLISKHKIYPDEIKDVKIAVPGKYTTANLLLNIAYPFKKQTKEYLFSDIEDAVIEGECDAGLIIHESRFTYEKKGLKKIIDLGEFWKNETNQLIPLGGIAAKRKLGNDLIKKIDRLIRKSIKFSIDYPSSPYNFIKKHSQSISDEVVYKHIQLYVNDYTLDLNEEGRRAISHLYKYASDKQVIPKIEKELFIGG